MSRNTEKVFSEMYKYIEKHGSTDMDEEQVNDLMQEFMQEYNANPPESVTEKTAKTSEDFLELAEGTDDIGKAGIYAKKALKLDPDNLDAERIHIECTSPGYMDLLKKLERGIKHGDEVMKKKGYMNEDYIGDFWGAYATRPYMRMRAAYVETLIDCGMYRKAIEGMENIIRLNETDNLGYRHRLMHMYALFEMEKEALELHEKYDNCDETMMLLPLSILYFKKGDLVTAEKYLKRLTRSNKDTKKFIKAYLGEDLERHAREMGDFGYRPYSIEEFLIELKENSLLIADMSVFFMWADEVLSKKKR